jgi:hypothetical protein
MDLPSAIDIGSPPVDGGSPSAIDIDSRLTLDVGSPALRRPLPGTIAWNGITRLLVDIPGVIDVCIQLGAFITDKLSVYRNDHVDANEIAYRFDSMWRKNVDTISRIRSIEGTFNDERKIEIFQNLNRLRDILANTINTTSRAGVQLGYNPTPGQAMLLSAFQKKKELEKLTSHAQLWGDQILKRLFVIVVTNPRLLPGVEVS